MATRKNASSWADIKPKLADLDRAGLMGLVQNLYAASKENQAFLHARFAVGDDVLKPSKASITQWINPTDPRKPLSVAKAKKAIADYQKALGQQCDIYANHHAPFSPRHPAGRCHRGAAASRVCL